MNKIETKPAKPIMPEIRMSKMLAAYARVVNAINPLSHEERRRVLNAAAVLVEEPKPEPTPPATRREVNEL